MGGPPAQKGSSVCACGRRGGGDGDAESWEIESACDDDGLGDSWNAEGKFVVHEKT